MLPSPVLRTTLFLGACMLAVTPAGAQPASTQQQLDELKKLIVQQQRVIEALQGQVAALKADSAATRETVDKTQQAVAETERKIPTGPLVTSAEPRIKLAISGQVNRMVNLADDGHSTDGYFVDNGLSPSRVRFVGEGRYSDDLTIGTMIEFAISPNNSNDVSQFSESSSDRLDARKVEAIFTSRSLGTVWFGKGDAATRELTRADLSRTEVLAYSNPADLAGGLFFLDDDGESTGIQIKNAITDFDGGRQNRVRYDTPRLAGFMLSGSVGEDSKHGAALRWAGEGHGLKAYAGVGANAPNRDGVTVAYTGMTSVLHAGTGLGLTAATGLQEQTGNDATFVYLKGGWQGRLFPIGDSAVSLDWQETADFTNEGDTARSFGLALVQRLEGYGTEFYAGLRNYSLSRDDTADPHDINVGTIGTRVKF